MKAIWFLLKDAHKCSFLPKAPWNMNYSSKLLEMQFPLQSNLNFSSPQHNLRFGFLLKTKLKIWRVKATWKCNFLLKAILKYDFLLDATLNQDQACNITNIEADRLFFRLRRHPIPHLNSIQHPFKQSLKLRENSKSTLRKH